MAFDPSLSSNTRERCVRRFHKTAQKSRQLQIIYQGKLTHIYRKQWVYMHRAVQFLDWTGVPCPLQKGGDCTQSVAVVRIGVNAAFLPLLRKGKGKPPPIAVKPFTTNTKVRTNRPICPEQRLPAVKGQIALRDVAHLLDNFQLITRQKLGANVNEPRSRSLSLPPSSPLLPPTIENGD